jgi:hypothetical protein
MRSKFAKSTNGQPLPGDTYEMKEAINALLDERLRFKRLTQYQLKVDRFSFYPGRETITEDENPELQAKGLQTFIDLIKRELPHLRRPLAESLGAIHFDMDALDKDRRDPTRSKIG